MSTESTKFFETWPSRMEKAKAALPEAMRGFGGLFQATMKEGALTVREKELIALGIGIAMRCDPCVHLHVQKCLEAGATRQQVLEAAAVVIMMQGGPGFTYMPKVVEALDAIQASGK